MTARDAAQPGNLASLSELAPELAEMLVSVASDIALVVNGDGVIQRIALGGGEPVRTMADDWVGRRFADTVTPDTRRKVEQLLADVAATGSSRSRQVNHPSPLGLDVPIAYSAVRLGVGGPLLVVGRDMTVVSAMQQRLLHAQAEMEREYWQRRQSETRYQLLFQIATDPVLVVDSISLNVIDANRAAARLFGVSLDQLIGKRAVQPLHEQSRAAVLDLFATAKLDGRAVDTEAVLAGPHRAVRVSVTPLRTESSTALLMRVRLVDSQWQVPEASARLLALMRLSPDAIVISDGDGRVQMANPAFVELAQVDRGDAVVGRPLSDWLGITGEDLASLLSALRRDIVCQHVATVLRGSAGRLTALELSAACLAENDEESFGFILRPAYGSGAARMPGIERPDPSIH